MDLRTTGFCVATLTLAACADVEVDPADGSEALEEIRIGAADVQGALCSPRRIIGISTGEDCLIPAGTQNANKWTVTNVLERGTPYLQDHPLALPGVAGRYCAYQWKQNVAPTLPQVNYINGLLTDEVLDCRAVNPMPPPQLPIPMSSHLGATLQALTREGAGRVEASELEVGGASSEDVRVDVRVTVLDTVPHDFQDFFNFDHGELIKRMIEDLACPATSPADCHVKVHRVLAMPRLSLTATDPTHGGRGGTFADLGGGLMEAHQRWWVAGHDVPHIINISAGWQDELFDDAGENMLANAEAVHTALMHLSCHGEIVVAAAGNQDAVTCSQEGIFPARWQEEAAPTEADCVALLGLPNAAALPVPIPMATRPLVYAAAGVELDGDLLAGTPSDSVPPLVALADHVVGAVTTDDPITGSSAAAALTTAAWAMAASYTPGANGWATMQAVFDGATLTEHELKMSLDGAPDEVRRVDICGALVAACDRPGITCPAFDSWCVPGVGAADLDELEGEVPTVMGTWVPPSPYGATDSCTATESICGATTQAIAPGDAQTTAAAQACAWNYSDPIAILVKPQPPKPPCPACTLTTEERKLYFTLSNDFAASDVSNVTLLVTDINGVEFSVNLGDPPVDTISTQKLDISERALPVGIVVKRAVVEVEIKGTDETNDALVLEL